MSHTLTSLLEVARIQSEINRLFDNLLDPAAAEGGPGFVPNVDIVETRDELVVRVELPGVERDGLTVSVHEGNIVVAGEKRKPEVDASAEFHVAERLHGPFRRIVPLGLPVNTHLAEARLNDGLLRISFPKVPNRRGEAVTIEVLDA